MADSGQPQQDEAAAVAVPDPVVPAVPSADAQFFCHKCNVEIEPTEQFTCPLCGSGFVEEMVRESGSAPSQAAGASSAGSAGMPDLPPILQRLLGPNLLEHLSDVVLQWADPHVGGLSLATGGIATAAGGGAESGSSGATAGSNAAGGRRPATGGRRSRVRPAFADYEPDHEANLAELGSIMQDFLVSVSGGPLEIHADNVVLSLPGLDGRLVQPMFVGNPDDYVYGRDGIDTIVTQLLNQIDGSGPAPLSGDLIDRIPVVKVPADAVRSKLQCSVCWDDFVEAEAVRELQCTHIFHENCIVPWLRLHATCPLCRLPVMSSSAAADVEMAEAPPAAVATPVNAAAAAATNAGDPVNAMVTIDLTGSERLIDEDGNVDFEMD